MLLRRPASSVIWVLCLLFVPFSLLFFPLRKLEALERLFGCGRSLNGALPSPIDGENITGLARSPVATFAPFLVWSFALDLLPLLVSPFCLCSRPSLCPLFSWRCFYLFILYVSISVIFICRHVNVHVRAYTHNQKDGHLHIFTYLYVYLCACATQKQAHARQSSFPSSACSIGRPLTHALPSFPGATLSPGRWQ